jgi:hypothetical protein
MAFANSRLISFSFLLLLFALTMAFIFNSPASYADNESAAYTTLDWIDLIPEDDLEALLNPPDVLNDMVDGPEGDILEQLTGTIGDEKDSSRYLQALVSTKVKPEFNNRKVKIPGYIVPLEFDDNQLITSFFLVPYFGACIHLPPPPPNQIIYSTYDKGISLDMMYDPFWIEGTMTTTLTENDLATASYAMTVEQLTLYDYQEEMQKEQID